MDRKNLFLGMACIVGALGLFFLTKPAPAPVPAGAPVAAVSALPSPTPVQQAPVVSASALSGQPVAASAVRRYIRENGHIRVTFTSRGGAVEKIELLRENADVGKTDKVLFNADNQDGALALALQHPLTKAVEPVCSEFKVEGPESKDSIVLAGALADGSKVVRTYALAADSKDASNDPYVLKFSTQVLPAAKGAPAPRLWVSTGAWHPTHGDSANQFLSVLSYDGEDLTRVGLDKFTDSSGFFGLGSHKAEVEHPVAYAAKPLAWVASGNQFFAAIVRSIPETRGTRADVLVRPVALPDGRRTLHAYVSWESPVRPDFSSTVEGDFFVGPKEYARVSALPDGQVAVLQFSKLLGFISFGAICKLLLASLGGVHWLLDWSGTWAWGWAIVALTVIIKLVTWPLTAAQQKAAKKMQKFAKPMQDIREKHKDNPEKMQKELMKLYTENKINPFAGCLPILIQMPIFFGLYTAFQTTVELRLHSFLWIADLSAPDTLFHLGSIPFNLLPILMGLTMWQSMRMTPNPSADSTQKTVFLMMTILFPVICYAMPAALTLYMTVQNLLTMLQSWLSNKEDAVEVIPPPAAKKAKG